MWSRSCCTRTFVARPYVRRSEMHTHTIKLHLIILIDFWVVIFEFRIHKIYRFRMNRNQIMPTEIIFAVNQFVFCKLCERMKDDISLVWMQFDIDSDSNFEDVSSTHTEQMMIGPLSCNEEHTLTHTRYTFEKRKHSHAHNSNKNRSWDECGVNSFVLGIWFHK